MFKLLTYNQNVSDDNSNDIHSSTYENKYCGWRNVKRITDISPPRVSLPRCFATENGNLLLILHAFRTRSSTLIFINFTENFIHEK